MGGRASAFDGISLNGWLLSPRWADRPQRAHTDDLILQAREASWAKPCVPAGLCTTADVQATADGARGRKHSSGGQIQTIFTSVGTPLGECRAKPHDFVPGGISLHKHDTAPRARPAGVRGASNAALRPEKLDNTMFFMFETRFPQHLTAARVRDAASGRRFRLLGQSREEARRNAGGKKGT